MLGPGMRVKGSLLMERLASNINIGIVDRWSCSMQWPDINIHLLSRIGCTWWYFWKVIIWPWARLCMQWILATTSKTKGGLEISMEEVSLLCPPSQGPNMRWSSRKGGDSLPLLPKPRVPTGNSLDCCWYYYGRDQVMIHIVLCVSPFLWHFVKTCAPWNKIPRPGFTLVTFNSGPVATRRDDLLLGNVSRPAVYYNPTAS